MAKIFLKKYFPPSMVTKLRNDITNFHQEPDESLFEAWERYKLSIDRCPNHNMLPVTQIDTFYNGLTMRHRDTINAAVGGTFMKRQPEECYDLIENMTAPHNDWDTSAQRSESSSSITSSNPEIVALKLEMTEINKNLMKVLQTNQQVKAVNLDVLNETCGNRNLLSYHSDNYLGPSGFNVKQNQNRNNQNQNQNRNQGNNQGRNQFFQGANHNPAPAYQAPPYQAPPYQAPPYQAPVHQAPIPQPQGATNSEFSNYIKANDTILRNMQTNMTSLTNSNLELKNMFSQFMKMNTASTSGSGTLPSNTVTNPREDLKDLSFKISLTDALILMPKFASTLKALSGNKEKLSEMARTPLNEHCSVVILNKLPEKLGDPGKFLIPCDFPRMDKFLALSDLGASINLMPLSMCKKLSLPELTPTFVDFDANPRVPLIPGISFLKTGRALIDVYEGELTLCVGKEAVTFNLDQTSRYSSNYDDNSINRIDVIELAYEEYSQKVLDFFDVIASGNPTPYYDPIVSTSSPTVTPFGDSDFLLEEVDAFLALEDDPTSPEVDHSYYDPDRDILFLEPFLNDDPSLPLLTQGNYLPEIRKELKVCEAKTDKSLIDEPPEVELKDLPPHLEYEFLEGDDKFLS
ncbi:reverse transcriptase domain-containing protein [Tanacetum coccineum]